MVFSFKKKDSYYKKKQKGKVESIFEICVWLLIIMFYYGCNNDSHQMVIENEDNQSSNCKSPKSLKEKSKNDNNMDSLQEFFIINKFGINVNSNSIDPIIDNEQTLVNNNLSHVKMVLDFESIKPELFSINQLAPDIVLIGDTLFSEDILFIDPPEKKNFVRIDSIDWYPDDSIGFFKDFRDEKVYSVIRINEKIYWMAENMKYKDRNVKMFTTNNNEFYYYDWNEAKKACPQGWKLPDKDEWNQLINFYGGKQEAFNALVIAPNNKNKMSLAGYVLPNGFSLENNGNELRFWTSSIAITNRNDDSNKIYLGGFKNGPFEFLQENKDNKHLVRCLKKNK